MMLKTNKMNYLFTQDYIIQELNNINIIVCARKIPNKMLSIKLKDYLSTD